jgi:class 3 adenylate cyclase
VNQHPREVVIRLERQTPREGAFTAVQASSLSLFRALFPQEVLAPGKLAAVSEVGLLAVHLAGADTVWANLGDGPAFTLLQDLLGKLEDLARREGGAVVQTHGRGGLVAFSDPLAALRAATRAPSRLDLGTEARLCVAVHRGPAMVATFNDRLGYFGATVRQVEQLAEGLPQGGILLSQPVVEDPQAVAYLRQRGLRVELAPVEPVPEGVGIPHLLVTAEESTGQPPC